MDQFAGVGQRVRIVQRSDTPRGDPLVGKCAKVVRFDNIETRGAWCAIDYRSDDLGTPVLPAKTSTYYTVDRGLVLLNPAWCDEETRST